MDTSALQSFHHLFPTAPIDTHSVTTTSDDQGTTGDQSGISEESQRQAWPFVERRRTPDRRLGRRSEIESISVLAHELRTPLSAMAAAVELLNDQPSNLDPDAREMVDRLQRSVHWIHGLVENLDTWGRIKEDRLVLKKTQTAAIDFVTHAVEMSHPLLVRRAQHISIVSSDASAVVCGDEMHLGQAVVNLITNASRYSGHGGTIVVSIDREHDRVRVRVSDNGPGIPLDEQANIFGRYQRGAFGVESIPDGQGLGLHIVRCLVEMHGGTVGVDSCPGEGASFWLTLPIADDTCEPEDNTRRITPVSEPSMVLEGNA